MQIYLYLFTLGGLAIAAIFNFHDVENEKWYLLTVATLLAVGLFSSTFGIVIADAKRHFRLILRAVTVGVILKALIIGAVMSLVLKSPLGFILGIIVAQIDPIATAAIMRRGRMSKPAQTIMRAWSSFDDPMTVILSLYVPVLIAAVTGAAWEPIRGTMQAAGISGYAATMGLNLLFAVGMFIFWRLLKRHSKATNSFVIVLVAVGLYGLLVGAFSIAVYYFWMLGMAIIGLFMRPPIYKAINFTLHWALSLSAVLLGILLIDSIDVWRGLALGTATYSAQIIVGLMLTRKLPSRDRWHIAFAQQNGITAIILALLFESYYPGTVAIVGPAVLVTNTLHAIANRFLDIHLDGAHHKLKPSHHVGRLKAHLHKVN